MRKMKKLALSRETVRRLIEPANLRVAAGYATLISECKQTYCVDTCTCSDPRYGC
jgi:hypothetical protein